MFYRKNVGTIERWLRFTAGCVMIACGAYLFGASARGLLLAASGVVTMATGVFGFCPACALVGRRLPDPALRERMNP